MEFTFSAYKDLIEILRKNGYCIADYHNYKEYEKAVILRHDVDMSLSKAVKMAKLEHDLGVSSTYYVLITSDFYNIFSRKNRSYLERIRDLGHTVGLHFDEVQYSSGIDIVSAIEREAELLGACLGMEVTSVSMHRPSPETLEADYRIKDGKIINSYGSEFFRNFKYVSDSRRNWREDVFKVIVSGAHPRLHILTHPIWYGTEALPMKTCLKEFVCQASAERYETLSENIRDLQEILSLEDI